MSVSIIPTLQLKRLSYVNKIGNYRNQITRCERAYDTLSDFKGAVSQAQSDFHSINSKKSSVLAGIISIKKNSLTAQKYSNGMQNILSGIGSKIVGVVYSVFIASISSKLKGYFSAINDYEDGITYCKRKIADIDRQIEVANIMIGGGQ